MHNKGRYLDFYKTYTECNFDLDLASKKYGILRDTGRRYLAEYKRLFPEGVSIEDIKQDENDRIISSLKIELSELKKKLLVVQQKSLISEQRLDTYLAISSCVDYIKINKTENNSVSETTAFLICSDWHVEESIKKESVNGLNEFNLKEAEKRVFLLFKKAVSLIDIWKTSTQINTLVLALLGDFMSGYIHEELKEDNNLSPVETILVVLKLIKSGIDYILEHTDCDIVLPCSIGNHSRTVDRPRVQTAYKNSYEWLMYHFLATLYEDEKRVKFQIANSYFNYLTVYGKVIRFHHGDWLRYSGGVGGISVPVNKAIAQWNIMKHADLDVFGHWHQHKDFNTWISNSSLIGHNAFAIYIKAAFERPSQTLFFLEKNKGKTATMPIYLD